MHNIIKYKESTMKILTLTMVQKYIFAYTVLYIAWVNILYSPFY
jgi:hypothetical protein